MEGVGQSRIVAPASYSCFILRVALPYKIATLLYAFNEQGEVLLLERAQDPNRGLWSPCGEIGRASCRERVLWVTGVQTCALPICCFMPSMSRARCSC